MKIQGLRFMRLQKIIEDVFKEPDQSELDNRKEIDRKQKEEERKKKIELMNKDLQTLSKVNIESYLDTHKRCPFCNGPSLMSGYSPDFDLIGDASVSNTRICRTCDKEWQEVYNLTSLYIDERSADYR